MRKYKVMLFNSIGNHVTTSNVNAETIYEAMHLTECVALISGKEYDKTKTTCRITKSIN
jgi:hypothetical protein